MIPFIFEAAPSPMANRVMAESAKQLHTLAIVEHRLKQFDRSAEHCRAGSSALC